MSTFDASEATVSDIGTRVWAAGFELARRLPRERELRQHLKAAGWRNGDHVFVTVDDELIIDVLQRLSLHKTRKQAIIAIASDQYPYGLGLLTVARRHRWSWRDSGERIDLHSGCSIGMLYSLLSPVGRYVPSQWMFELRCEKVDG